MSLLCLPCGKFSLAFLAVPAGKDGRVECPCQTVNDFIGVRGNVCGLFLFVQTHAPLTVPPWQSRARKSKFQFLSGARARKFSTLHLQLAARGWLTKCLSLCRFRGFTAGFCKNFVQRFQKFKILAHFHDLDTQVPHGLGGAGVFHAFPPVAGLLHIRFAIHLSCSDAADHDVDVDVSRMVVPIRVSTDDGRMTGEVFFAEFQAKCLCLFHGQAVVGCISGVKADDMQLRLALFIQKLLSGERIVLVNEICFDGGVVRVFITIR